MEVKLHAVSISALDGTEWSDPRSGRFTPGEESWWLVGPRAMAKIWTPAPVQDRISLVYPIDELLIDHSIQSKGILRRRPPVLSQWGIWCGGNSGQSHNRI